MVLLVIFFLLSFCVCVHKFLMKTLNIVFASSYFFNHVEQTLLEH